MNERDALQTMVTSDDNLPRLNVWVLQDAEKADLLKLVLKPEHLEYMTAVIVLDFDQPWEMMESLTKWTSLLNDIVQGFMKELPLEQRDTLKTRLARHFKNFDLEGNGKVPDDNKKKEKTNVKEKEDINSDSDDSAAEDFMNYLEDQVPLPEGVLKSNLGIPIIVACHKADLIGRGDRAQFLE